MADEALKAFILYCQGVETAWHEWKNYWINFLMKKQVDLYNPDDFNMLWLKNQKNNSLY